MRAGGRFETPRTLSGNEAPLTTPAVGPNSDSPIAELEGLG
ncbi:hypothetical protein ACH5A2_07130 [Streptomyces collinus]